MDVGLDTRHGWMDGCVIPWGQAWVSIYEKMGGKYVAGPCGGRNVFCHFDMMGL